ncbi:hypothetical protein T12_1638 [Trichinella patagoniensis]|uniref:Uncharacterized protein n=1 Tax=Trichinella patagoniensis TaxID=990121 RepID=A0A0V0YRH5_9BILA|nr:hypothetical protein T12_1638 [Trichinella patagoniensis]
MRPFKWFIVLYLYCIALYLYLYCTVIPVPEDQQCGLFETAFRHGSTQ